MPPCPRKVGQLQPLPMPRPVLSSLRMSATQLAQQPVTCSCQHPCSPETCVDSSESLQTSPAPACCPHGLAVDEDDEECTGSCREDPEPPPPAPCPVCSKHMPAQASPSVELNQPIKPTPCCKNANKSTEQNKPAVTGGSCCSGSCPVSRKTSLNNATSQQRLSAGNVGAQEKPASQSFDKFNEQSKPEEESKGSCCKTGKGIQSGPHMHSDTANQSVKGRRPSLVQIQNGNRRVSIKGQPENVIMENEAEQPAPGPTCQRGGGGLFPAAGGHCLCRMPPAFNGVCTGNLSGTCNCTECSKQ